MKRIKVITSKIKNIILKNKLICLILILAVVIGKFAIPRIFAQLQPVKSVEILSEKLDYNKKEPGSWKIDKSAKWISKGTAEITFDLDTTVKNNNKYTDVIFVLDVSGSMEGDKLERVKSDAVELVNYLLDEEKNRAALITFEERSEILSNLTNDKEELTETINNLTTGNTTNYYQALVNVDSILKEYQKLSNRECLILFLTDGYPNVETPNEVGQYGYLKNQYPYININGIQYEMGNSILEPIKKISDNQYFADMSSLKNILFEASTTAITYDNFEITDYIDTNYFYVDDINAITVNRGKIEFDKENQKVIWNLAHLKTGATAKMTIKAKLKEEYVGEGGFYPTNEKETIKSETSDIVEDVTSPKTPVLSDKYKVIYEGNEPDGCELTEIPKENNHFVFDVVQISDTTPKCQGYKFKGWKIVNKNVQKVNSEYFYMPEEDVTIRAEWSKLALEKSLEGEVAKVQTLNKIMKDNAVLDNKASEFVTNENGINFDNGGSNTNGKGLYEMASTKDDENPIYYYRGSVTNNNVIFANSCWKIVRTTSTGGVKLLYNGIPNENGGCTSSSDYNNVGKDDFNDSGQTLASIGYMYGTRYISYGKRLATEERMVSWNWFGYNYYYGSNPTYEDGVYKFDETTKMVQGQENELIGKYLFEDTDNTKSSTNIKYVVGVGSKGFTSCFIYYIDIKDGKTLEDYNKVYTYGTDIVVNEDGTYTLKNPMAIGLKDWHQQRENIKVGYYTCLEDGETCSNPKAISKVTDMDMYYTDISNVYSYGSSFTFSNGKYTLKDTTEFWDFTNSHEELNNRHYTCFNKSGECYSLSYIHNVEDDKAYYISLKNGNGVEEAISEMQTNTTNSKVKDLVDTWYEQNMIDYTDYLEDTVWCNDRSMVSKSTNGWNPNGGNVEELALLTGMKRLDETPRKLSLTCSNKNDSFTVSEKTGNGALKYPVGLVTADEIVLAGNPGSSYMNSGYAWTMTPAYYGTNYTRVYHIGSGLTDNSAINKFGARPSISLIKDTLVIGGNGTSDSPYRLDLATKYTITVESESSNIIPTKTKSLAGGIITLNPSLENYEVTSFKLNGTLIEGNSFEMPEEDVYITDVVTKEISSN